MYDANIEQFKLSKIKKIKNGGMEIDWEMRRSTDNENYEIPSNIKNPVIPHPDLVSLFDKLKPFVARIYNWTLVREIVKNREFKATPDQSKLLENYVQEMIGKITISGISVSGEDQHAGVIITAVFEHEVNSKSAINGHRIRFSSNVYGFEDEIREICESIERESFEYLYEDKKAQLDVFPGK